jgi:hypothetical protein
MVECLCSVDPLLPISLIRVGRVGLISPNMRRLRGKPEVCPRRAAQVVSSIPN